jgi:hypothetical protein
MDKFTLPAIALAAVATLFGVLRFGRRNNSDAIDIEAGAHDAELVGPVTITRDVHYPGTRDPESGHALVRYDATNAAGTTRVSKWILARDRSYLTGHGHFVLYEYRRPDGSLESDRLVSPEANLGGGIYVKERQRFFDENNQLCREKYLREDGTLGLVSEHASGLFQHFRLDGRTLHSEYFSTVGVGQRSVIYRRDGKTVWLEKDESDNVRVYFDLNGNPVDLRFSRERVAGSFGMGSESAPVLFAYDNYHREDGTLAYQQAWFVKWDKALGGTVDALGKVVVYDLAGKPIAEHDVELDAATQQRISDDVMFQGFMWNVFGTYDDESHDI